MIDAAVAKMPEPSKISMKFRRFIDTSGNGCFVEMNFGCQYDWNGDAVKVCRLILPLLHAFDRSFDEQWMAGNDADLLDAPLCGKRRFKNNRPAHTSP